MATIWKYVAIIFAGIIVGIVAAIKWIAPPEADLTIGKIKVKGRGNTQNTTIEIEDSLSAKEKRKQKRAERKEKRQ